MKIYFTMKKVLVFILLAVVLLSNNLLFAQQQMNMEVKLESEYSYANEGNAVITSVQYDENLSSWSTVTLGYSISGTQDGNDFTIYCGDYKQGIKLTPVTDNIQDFWNCVNIKSLSSLSLIDGLYDIRREVESDAFTHLANYSKYDLFLDDPILESYIYGLVFKIAPQYRPDMFPYNLNVKIVKDPSMNACIFPNGTLIVNTGLLASLHTEDELVAILAHEIAHYVANHSFVNLQKKIQRERAAAIWGTIFTSIAAISEVSLASQGVYVDGSLTYNTAVLAAITSANILENLGMEYSRAQEKEADMLAIEVLKLLGYDENACATVFGRMKKVYDQEGAFDMADIEEDHPSLNARIKYSGTPNYIVDQEFEKIVSFAVTNCAIHKFNRARFSQALEYVNQNITNGVATDDDYLIKARSLLNLYNTQESNLEALNCIQISKQLNPSNINVIKTEILVLIRNKEYSHALEQLSTYQEKLARKIESLSNKSYDYRYYLSEYDWARKVSIKLNGMI